MSYQGVLLVNVLSRSVCLEKSYWSQIDWWKDWKKLNFMRKRVKMLDLTQNLFLEVKRPEIKETKGTFISPTFESSYWEPFSGLAIEVWKSQTLVN